jgi:hypothetical protein
MMDGERRLSGKQLLAALGVLVGAGWLVVAVLESPQPSTMGAIIVGVTWGTAYGQASLAAAWCALGPLGLTRRLSLALVWVGVLIVAMGLSIRLGSVRRDELSLVLLNGVAIILQWVVVQMPLWVLARWKGWRIARREDESSADAQRKQQFGIRHLLALMLLVALVLGAGRMAFGSLQWSDVPSDWLLIAIFLLIGASNTVIAVPLAIVALLRRSTLAVSCISLGLVTLVTAIELALLRYLTGSPLGSEDFVSIVVFNVVQGAWIVVVIRLLRAGGYELAARGERRAASGGG